MSIGSVNRRPGARYAAPASDCASARSKMSIGFQPILPSTNSDRMIVAVISSTALMICTHVVASMPPKIT